MNFIEKLGLLLFISGLFLQPAHPDLTVLLTGIRISGSLLFLVGNLVNK